MLYVECPPYREGGVIGELSLFPHDGEQSPVRHLLQYHEHYHAEDGVRPPLLLFATATLRQDCLQVHHQSWSTGSHWSTAKLIPQPPRSRPP